MSARVYRTIPPTPTDSTNSQVTSIPALKPAAEAFVDFVTAPPNAAVSYGYDSVTVTSVTTSWSTVNHDGPPSSVKCKWPVAGTRYWSSRWMPVSEWAMSVSVPET